jgi:hypothetical protein
MRKAVVAVSLLAIGASPATSSRDLTRNLTMISYAGGFVLRHGYYTPVELTDPAIERALRQDYARTCEKGVRFVRRDVRWYEPTVPGGERCAAVIHVVTCNGKQPRAVDVARTRAELVALEPDPPIGARCQPSLDELRKIPGLFERWASQIRPTNELGCDVSDLTPDRPIHIWPTTRFGAVTLVDPGLMKSGAMGYVDFVRRTPEVIIGVAANSAGELDPQFSETGEISQQGTNIAITQAIGSLPSGGYCVVLTARQGNQIWRRIVARRGDSLAELDRQVPKDADFPNASPILRDARALMRQLRAALISRRYALDQQ